MIGETLGRDRRADSLVDQSLGLHDPGSTLRSGLDSVADLHLGRGLGRLTVDSDMTTLAGIRRVGPGLEQPNRPQPRVHSNLGHSVSTDHGCER